MYIRKNDDRLAWLDIARGISVALIVFFHSADWISAYHRSSHVFEDVNLLFRPIRIPLLFVVSGILAERYIKMPWKQLFFARILPIAYVYLLWSVINWTYFSIYSDGVHVISYGKEISQVLSLWYLPPLGLWYLWCLAICHVIVKLIAAYKSTYMIILALLSTVIFFGYYFDSIYIAYTNLFSYFVFFYAGVKYKNYICECISKNSSAIFLIGSVCFIVTGAAVYKLPIEYYKNSILFGALRLILSLSGVATGLAASKLITPNRYIGSALNYLGRRTIHIYVVNQMIISLISSFFLLKKLNVELSIFFVVPLVSALTVGVSLALARLIFAINGSFMYGLPKNWIHRSSAHLCHK